MKVRVCTMISDPLITHMEITTVNMPCEASYLPFSSLIWGELNQEHLKQAPWCSWVFVITHMDCVLLSIKKLFLISHLPGSGGTTMLAWLCLLLQLCVLYGKGMERVEGGSELPAGWGTSWVLLLLEDTSSSPHLFLLSFWCFYFA